MSPERFLFSIRKAWKARRWGPPTSHHLGFGETPTSMVVRVHCTCTSPFFFRQWISSLLIMHGVRARDHAEIQQIAFAVFFKVARGGNWRRVPDWAFRNRVNFFANILFPSQYEKERRTRVVQIMRLIQHRPGKEVGRITSVSDLRWPYRRTHPWCVWGSFSVCCGRFQGLVPTSSLFLFLFVPGNIYGGIDRDEVAQSVTPYKVYSPFRANSARLFLVTVLSRREVRTSKFRTTWIDGAYAWLFFLFSTACSYFAAAVTVSIISFQFFDRMDSLGIVLIAFLGMHMFPPTRSYRGAEEIWIGFSLCGLGLISSDCKKLWKSCPNGTWSTESEPSIRHPNTRLCVWWIE